MSQTTLTYPTQIMQGLPGPMADGPSGGTPHTRMRHARYGQLYLWGTNGKSYFISGVQMLKFRETNGSHFEAGGGNDWVEYVPGMRTAAVQCRRQMPRNGGLKEMILYAMEADQKGSATGDVDFRELPLLLTYEYLYQSATGDTTFEDAIWNYHDVWISDYEWGYDSPNGLLYETFSCISRGNNFADNYGSGSNPTATNTVSYDMPSTLYAV